MELIDLNVCGIPAAADRVATVLQQSGAVALVPTETVYGLICRAADAAARERVFEMKRRSGTKQLGWFVDDWRRLPQWNVRIDGWVERLARRYCPGAITIIAPLREGGTVGFRIPDHPLLAAIMARIPEPLCQTSANLSGHPDAESAAAAAADLAGSPDIAVEAGWLPPGVRASTVVDATGEAPVILRQGALKVEEAVGR